MSSEVRVDKVKYGEEEGPLVTVLLWALTIYQLALIFLFVWLVLAPYYGSAAGSRTYIDPNSVAPFAWEGIGELLYQWAFAILCLAGPLGIFGLAAKAFLMGFDWHEMQSVSGVIHVGSWVISLVMMVFSCSWGIGIGQWLVD